MATPNCLKSIFSAGGYFYLEPRTLQVLCCLCVVTVRDKLSEYFLKRQAPNRTQPKPEFRKVALEFYLAEALSNLPEFGSEQTMKFEATYEHNVAA